MPSMHGVRDDIWLHRCTLHKEGIAGGTLRQPLLQDPALAGEDQRRHAADCVHRILHLLPVRVVWLLLCLELPPAVWRPPREVLCIRSKGKRRRLYDSPGGLLPQEASCLLWPGAALAAERPAQQGCSARRAQQRPALTLHPSQCCAESWYDANLSLKACPSFST